MEGWKKLLNGEKEFVELMIGRLRMKEEVGERIVVEGEERKWNVDLESGSGSEKEFVKGKDKIDSVGVRESFRNKERVVVADSSEMRGNSRIVGIVKSKGVVVAIEEEEVRNWPWNWVDLLVVVEVRVKLLERKDSIELEEVERKDVIEKWDNLEELLRSDSDSDSSTDLKEEEELEHDFHKLK